MVDLVLHDHPQSDLMMLKIVEKMFVLSVNLDSCKEQEEEEEDEGNSTLIDF